MMVEQVSAPPSSGHWKEKKNKDSSENLHQAVESHIWVENLHEVAQGWEKWKEKEDPWVKTFLEAPRENI